MKTHDLSALAYVAHIGRSETLPEWLTRVFEAVEERSAPGGSSERELLVAVREHVHWIVTAVLDALGRGCPHRAEDLAHDVLVKLLKRDALRNYDPQKGSLRMWLMGLIRWTVMEGVRRDRSWGAEHAGRLLGLPDLAPTPDLRTEEADLAELVRGWVSELASSRRAAVQRKYLAGPGAVSGGTNAPHVYAHRSRGLVVRHT